MGQEYHCEDIRICRVCGGDMPYYWDASDQRGIWFQCNVCPYWESFIVK